MTWTDHTLDCGTSVKILSWIEVKNVNLKSLESIARNTNKTWYLLQSEVAVVLGITRQSAAIFLNEQSVPFYTIGKSKKYLLPDVIDAVERNRWKSAK